MTDTAKKTAAADEICDNDPEVLRQLISTMEGILEVFPEDVSALESLSAAYQQAGEFDKSADTALKLARLVVAEGNLERAYTVVDHVLSMVPDHAEALKEKKHISDSLALLGIEVSGLTIAAEEDEEPPLVNPVEDRAVLARDLSGELELAWLLLQRNLLRQEQYETAIANLTENRSTIGSSSCLSLLIEIASMDNINLEAIIGELSEETETPYIDITKFELSPEAVKLIPFDDCRRLGVLPFTLFKDEVMVATLNPVDKGLREAVCAYLRTRAHFFFTSPDQFQSALIEAMTLLEDDA
ncbi:MAG: hypothetical protein RRC34_06030 [Lentisphaeria bacterium]|nr:hypothetical protein [Lentisphaeria bacterium]